MNKSELGNILKDMYNNAPDKDQVAMIHLFAIKYSEFIIDKYTAAEIIRVSGINKSYGTEVNKGLRLSQYVKPIE